MHIHARVCPYSNSQQCGSCPPAQFAALTNKTETWYIHFWTAPDGTLFQLDWCACAAFPADPPFGLDKLALLWGLLFAQRH
jgi:hypothetical protein